MKSFLKGSEANEDAVSKLARGGAKRKGKACGRKGEGNLINLLIIVLRADYLG